MKNEKIVSESASLKQLLKRFSNSDVIATMEKEYRTNKPVMISPSIIDDNKFLKRAKLNLSDIKKDFQSVKTRGIATPILVKIKKDHYELILGRKRLIAAKVYHLDAIPCFIVEMSEEEMLLMIAADIRDSKTNNMVELSLICSRLSGPYAYSQADLAKLLRVSRSQITNVIRLSTLPDDILLDVSLGKLSFGHAKTLIALPEEIMKQVVERIYKDNLSVRDTEKVIEDIKNGTNYKEMQDLLSKKYHCEVDVSKKKVVFSFEDQAKKADFIEKIK